jgi:hypothetical protein
MAVEFDVSKQLSFLAHLPPIASRATFELAGQSLKMREEHFCLASSYFSQTTGKFQDARIARVHERGAR